MWSRRGYLSSTQRRHWRTSCVLAKSRACLSDYKDERAMTANEMPCFGLLKASTAWTPVNDGLLAHRFVLKSPSLKSCRRFWVSIAANRLNIRYQKYQTRPKSRDFDVKMICEDKWYYVGACLAPITGYSGIAVPYGLAREITKQKERTNRFI